jgi:hypothetical protein
MRNIVKRVHASTDGGDGVDEARELLLVAAGELLGTNTRGDEGVF